MAYNLKNYLSMEVFTKKGKEQRPKKTEEINHLIQIISAEKPDILGVCEIGTSADLADLQKRLKEAGLNLPHSVHSAAFDQVRRLGILSSYPILKNNPQTTLSYQMNGQEFLHRRGILDTLIDLPSGPTHFIGVHFKSKRPAKTFDQAQARLNEARLTRRHCLSIFEKKPNARILLYGDVNDTRKTPPVSALMGHNGAPTFLNDILVKDSRGHIWTHYWAHQQQYARIDYVFTSPSLRPHINRDKSYIADPPNWFQASDHRPIIITIQ